MQVITRPAKVGVRICGTCNGELQICESKQRVTPVDGSMPYDYIMEFALCQHCGEEYVLTDSIHTNDKRRKQARLEATVAWKMKKWLNKQV